MNLTLKKGYQLIKIVNNWQDIQFTFDYNKLDNYEGAEVLYDKKDISESTITQYNDMELIITNKDNKLEWTKLDKAIKYTVYLSKKDKKREKLMNNFCYIEKEKEIEKIEVNNTVFDIGNERNENYIVTVIAEVEEKSIPMKFKLLYNQIELNLKEDSNNKTKIIWIVIIVILAVALIGIAIVFLIRFRARRQIRSDSLMNDMNNVDKMNI